MNFKNEDVKQVMSDVFGVEPKTINDDSSIDTIETWDSLRHLNLVLALEEKFKLSLTEEETVEILNYKLIKMTLEKHGIRF